MDNLADTLVPYLHDIPVVISLLYYSVTIVTGRVFRSLITQNISSRWQPYLLNTVTACQLMACSLENNHIKYFYGTTAYWLTLSGLSVWSSLTISGSSSNPCYQMMEYLTGAISSLDMVCRICCQLAGGLLSFQYARQFWRLGLHSGHVRRYNTLHCSTDLTVSTSSGFGLEFVLTMFDTIMCLIAFTPFIFCENVAKTLISCYFVTIGLHLTGMYGNPINATNQTFGCEGISVLQHLFVYWVAPLLAVVISYKIHKLTSDWLKPTDKDSRTSNGILTESEDENANIKTINTRQRRTLPRNKKQD